MNLSALSLAIIDELLSVTDVCIKNRDQAFLSDDTFVFKPAPAPLGLRRSPWDAGT